VMSQPNRTLSGVGKHLARGHKFIGEDEAGEIIEHLNKPKLKPADPVAVLVELARRYEAEGDEPEKFALGTKIVNHINASMTKHKLRRVEIHTFHGPEGFGTIPAPLGDPARAELSRRFHCAVDLHKQGLLGRIRRCAKADCRAWFFAVLPHQMFHSDACRTATTSTDPKFRERRMKYMRYMRQLRKQTKPGKPPASCKSPTGKSA
jgi:hypothetical protein